MAMFNSYAVSLPEGKNIQGPVFWAKIWVSCERSQITYRTCCFRLVGDKFSSIESSGQDLVVARCRLLGLGPRGFGGRRHLSLINRVKKRALGWSLAGNSGIQKQDEDEDEDDEEDEEEEDEEEEDEEEEDDDDDEHEHEKIVCSHLICQ